MVVTVLGTRYLDFETSDGNKMQGTQIFCYYADPNVKGFKCDKVFVSSNSKVVVPNFIPLKEYDFVYTGLGRSQTLVSINPVE